MAHKPRPYVSTLRVSTDPRTRRKWAANLRAMRLARGLSQTQLAARIGCTRQTVSAWERGIATPTLETRKRIARVFNTSVARAFPATNAA